MSTFVPHFLVHALFSSLPLFVPIWLAEFELTRATIGSVMGAVYIFYGGVAIPAGVLADRYGSINFVAVFLFGSAAGAIALGLSTTFIGLVFAVLGIGFAGGLYHPPAFRLISSQSFTSSSLFAYHNVGGNLGLGLGPFLTAILLAFATWRTAMLIAGVVLVLSGVLFVRYGPSNTTPDYEETAGSERRIGRVRTLFSVGFTFVLLIYLLRGTFYRGAIVFIPDYLSAVATVDSLTLFGREVPPSQWVYSLMLLVGVGGQFLGGYVDDRFDTIWFLAIQLLLVSGILAVIGRTSGPVLFFVILLFGFGMMMLAPALQNLVAKHTAESNRGFAYGFTTAGSWAAGGFLGASLAGLIATVGSYPQMFSVLSLISLVTVGVVLVYAVRFHST
ncbi:MAG: MFS transporter [Halodesulfurarchaeum sp.]